mgnify:CR=1 FL=1
MSRTRTQVVIVGGGPSGLLLSHILDKEGIDSIVLEHRPREYVLARIRAGVLEAGTVQLLRDYGLAERLDAEGSVHDGTGIAWAGREHFTIDILRHTGKALHAFGQTAITEELYKARDRDGGVIVEEALDVMLHDLESGAPYVTYEKDGERHRVDADQIAGCDGFHGVSRRSIPDSVLRTWERTYPFGWLGVMSRTAPVGEIIYANHPDGFAMCSQRNSRLSRYYVQCPADDEVESWSDDRFWDALTTRLGPDIGDRVETGPSIEKSIAPLRSFIAEPMRFGSLFLVGDAAHVVPPTGAKGLNLAVSDVHYLSRALIAHHREGRSDGLERYSDTALRRVWASTKFSWRFTSLLHRFPDQSEFDQRMQEVELGFLRDNEPEQASVAHQYVGLPY